MIRFVTEIHDDLPQFLTYWRGYIRQYSKERYITKIHYSDLYNVVKTSDLVLTVEAELDWLPNQIDSLKFYLKAILAQYAQDEPYVLLTASFSREAVMRGPSFDSIESFIKGITRDEQVILGLYEDAYLRKNRVHVRAFIGGHASGVC